MQQVRRAGQKGFPARPVPPATRGTSVSSGPGPGGGQTQGAVPSPGGRVRVVAVGHDADTYQRAGGFAEGVLEIGADVALIVQPLVELAGAGLHDQLADTV